MRWLMTGALLILAGCGAAGPREQAQPFPATETQSAGSADTPLPILRGGGFRTPHLRRDWEPSDARPDWLPALPPTIERYPVPREWLDDGRAGLWPDPALRAG